MTLIKKKILARITEESKIRPNNLDEWYILLESLKGSDVIISIDKATKKRTIKQNDYLWGAIYKTISLHTGYTEMELHKIFGAMFLTYQVEFNKKLITRIKSTTELNTGELGEYIRNIEIEVSTMGITLPTTEEYNKI